MLVPNRTYSICNTESTNSYFGTWTFAGTTRDGFYLLFVTDTGGQLLVPKSPTKLDALPPWKVTPQ